MNKCVCVNVTLNESLCSGYPQAVMCLWFTHLFKPAWLSFNLVPYTSVKLASDVEGLYVCMVFCANIRALFLESTSEITAKNKLILVMFHILLSFLCILV